MSTLTHPRVEVSHLSRFAVLVCDLDMLVATGVNHHVPRVSVQAVGPVVVTLTDKKQNHEDIGRHGTMIHFISRPVTSLTVIAQP